MTYINIYPLVYINLSFYRSHRNMTPTKILIPKTFSNLPSERKRNLTSPELRKPRSLDSSFRLNALILHSYT